ncbi:YdiU family protein [Paenibacillus dokdonensis]|uniref:Protein nucleotidyltransferase YdiU n=1 Tax=Paenibacillus dokdonensis TaxID=2567944 RepID=A0ABU6GLI8_9BACL|nr:YdiU family protein [Paenibacillus dokdonensis]MEC0240620.1 YdiU family protein [Paenibacillus dokdonensis]
MTKRDECLETGWNFDHSYTRLPQLFFSRMDPAPVKSPLLVIFNEKLAASLALNAAALESEEGVAELAGNRVPEGALPIAQAYAGHQFGHFNMLGDGRAVLLGEHITPQGERVDIQLKGSGPTPYSRRGDGRAALGPMLREYIISEAMHALGIPTTRSLAVVSTGESVIREKDLQGAILTRVAASHLRVGTFEYAAQLGNVENLRTLAHYTLQRHYPDVEDDGNRYLHFLQEVIKRQAMLIAKWQLVGFIHGVMNTDNMAISGETIDYGPCAFMDTYDPATVFSSIDREGRYAYGNQPYIGGWNLARFAEAILPLLHDNQSEAIELAQGALSEYTTLYFDSWTAGMRAKLGIFNEEQQDETLIKDLLNMMHKYQADYTNTFLALTFNTVDDMVLSGTPEFTEWYTLWQERLDRQQESKESTHELMRSSNPAIIPRNHRVEEALEAAEKNGDYSVMEQLLEALSSPFAHSPEQAVYAALPVDSSRPYRTFCGT